MRKYILIVLMLGLGLLAACDYMPENTLVQVGDTINFGNYNWQVIAIYDNNTALVITENVMMRSTFHDTQELSITWDESDLRSYLNSVFLQAFSEDEQKRIIPRINHTPNNEWYGTRGGHDTTDYIFLLSIGELVMYLGDSGQLENPAPSQYGIHQWLLSDRYDAVRSAVDLDGAESWWWLRSPGFDLDFVATVREDGSIRIDGNNINVSGGVRPALLLNLKVD